MKAGSDAGGRAILVMNRHDIGFLGSGFFPRHGVLFIHGVGDIGGFVYVGQVETADDPRSEFRVRTLLLYLMILSTAYY